LDFNNKFFTFTPVSFELIPTMIPEPEVVEEFASGSHEAFHRIFKLFYPKVYAFIRGFIKDAYESEDLTQIVFIKLWEKREVFLKVHHFDSYLFTLTKYTVYNYISAKKTDVSWNENNIPETSDEYTPHDELIAKDLQLLMDMVVSKMPPKRKLIYELSRKKGLSNEQIAEKLGIQKKTVENHLNIALNELRETLSLSVLLYLILSA